MSRGFDAYFYDAPGGDRIILGAVPRNMTITESWLKERLKEASPLWYRRMVMGDWGHPGVENSEIGKQRFEE